MKHLFTFFFLCLRLHVFFSVGFDKVSLMEGDSVTLQIDVKKNQEEAIHWYFNYIHIAEITRDQICTDYRCEERFRDRLKLDHQTGSLTIKNVKMIDSGYYVVSNYHRNRDRKVFMITVHGVLAEQATMKRKKVKGGESVTLDPGVIKNPNDLMTWCFKDILIAEITGDQSKTCEDGDERFRERLKLDHQTGSLTIMNTRNTDSGDYELQITSRNNSVIISSVKTVIVIDTGTDEDVDTDEVSVIEGDSVTLHTDADTDQQEMILWYFNGFQIAEITGDQSKICTEVQYTERFRDRLKLDHQTGSLTIMNITNTDSGLYELLIFSYRASIKTLIVAVHDVPAAQRDEMRRKSAKEGESVTLDPGVVKKTNDVMTWYFNDTVIAEIIGDQSKICTDDRCEEIFRNRLEINNKTGSLTIINIRITDSGPYKLQITSRNNIIRISSYKNFTVIVTGFFGVDTDGVSVFVKVEDSVTLHTDVEKEQMEKILWYFDGYQIAQITGNLSRIYTEDRGTERFRDRLKLDYQTGSLTITNTTFGDSGIYHLRMFSNKRGRISRKIFIAGIYGFFDNDTDGVPAFVKQGDSITLHTGVEANQQDRIIWYFYDTLIAEITGDISYVCIDIRCEDGTERFRDRLNLDNQTGSLTITNITYTDAGVYQQVIISSNSSSSEKNFIVSVYGVQQFVYGLDIRSSGTLDPGVIKKPNDVMTWYFRDILIAEIIGDQSKICTEERCKQIFRDRLEVNHQTGSLTITNTKTKDFGIFNLLISSNNFSIMKTFHVILFGTRVFLEDEYLYVFENDQVTLHTNVETNQQEVIQWYFSGIHIAEISGDLSFICTDVQCNNGTERFRDRLELDHQTGSLTIPYIGDTDHGVYHLQIICSSGIRTTKKFLVLLTHSACAPNEEVPVLVMVKDSVTLHTDAKTYEYEKIVWCFNDIRIAVITGDLRYNCTDVQCNKGTERFRDRLKLDHQTGSLTITNIMTSDAGYYDLYFESGCSSRVFMVFLSGGFAAELVTVQSVKEGESVTLDPGELKIPYDLMTWYFNDILIAKISRDHKISTDEQCEDGNEGLRERLQLDHQTGSLTIMNTKNTDSGLYKLQITHRDKSISISSFRSFGVNVTAIPDSGLSTAVVAGASAAAAAVVLLITAAAGVIYRHKHQAKMNDIRTQSNDQADGAEDLSPTQFNLLLSDTTRTCLNQPETPTETPM